MPRERPDDARGGHGGFEDVSLKPLVEEVGGAHGHELDEVVHIVGWEELKTLAEKGELLDIARIEGRGVGGDHGEERLDETAHRDHGLPEFFVGLGVELGVTFELAACLGMIVYTPEIVAAGHGSERAVEWKNFEAVAGKIEIADNFRAQERNNVRKNRKLKARKDFFGDGCASQNVTAFQNQDFLTGSREIGRVHQAVVAATDDDCIVLLWH